jgi:very-short-patch-repair endonuclease
LWSILRARQIDGFKFVRQFPIGPYVADFACREAALVIEVDGGQHSGNHADIGRTAYLNAQSYGVLRFWNHEVLSNIHGVVDAVSRVIAGAPSSDLRFSPAALTPSGRGESGARAATAKKRSYRLTAVQIKE